MFTLLIIPKNATTFLTLFDTVNNIMDQSMEQLRLLPLATLVCALNYGRIITGNFSTNTEQYAASVQ